MRDENSHPDDMVRHPDSRHSRIGPLSRRQLLAAGAGVAGVAAGVGLLGESDSSLAASIPQSARAAAVAAPLTGAYMTVTGSEQGPLSGDSGKGKDIALKAVSADLTVPFDSSSGVVTGRRQHQPFTVTKALGPASPQLFQAGVTGEVLTSVVINLLKATSHGAAKPYFRIALVNAIIVGLNTYTSDTEASHMVAFGIGEFEDVSFTFEKVTLTDLTANTTGTDNWGTAP